MKTVLPGELAVVVADPVQRHDRVGHVVREVGAEKQDVGLAERSAAPVGFEGALQVAELLRGAPRQQSLLRHAILAELRDRLVVAARQRRKRILAVPIPVDVEKMIGRLLDETGGAPRVGIDGALDHHRAIRLEERPQLRRQQRDRAVHDEVMRGESPRVRGRRRADE